MADDETAQEDRTEAPSAKRLQKAYDEGKLPLGRDFNAVAGFAAGTAALVSLGPGLQKSLVRLVAASAQGMGDGNLVNPRALFPLLAQPLLLIGIVAAVAAVAGSLSYIAQTRGRFWPELAMPDLTRVFSGGKITQLFSKKTAADLGMALVKLATVGWACWSTLRMRRSGWCSGPDRMGRRAKCPLKLDSRARIAAPAGPIAAKARSSASASCGPMPRR